MGGHLNFVLRAGETAKYLLRVVGAGRLGREGLSC